MKTVSHDYPAALQAMKIGDYKAASAFFRDAEKDFAGNANFRILGEAVELIIAVRETIAALTETEER
jgi:hypothetical protein